MKLSQIKDILTLGIEQLNHLKGGARDTRSGATDSSSIRDNGTANSSRKEEKNKV